jgi:lambda family phage portal protein
MAPHGILERFGGWIDRFVAAVNPAAGLRRQLFRQQFAAESHRGASRDRLRAGWLTTHQSADDDILDDLPTLRERSRELVRNDGNARGVLNRLTDNVVGSGFHPQVRVDRQTLGITESEATEWQEACERAWFRWTKFADATEKLPSWAGVQRLLVRSMVENGDSLAHLVRISDENRPFQLAIEMIEADRLATPRELEVDEPARKVRGGVELDRIGRPRRYWVMKSHPTSRHAIGTQKDFIGLRRKTDLGRHNCIHLFAPERIGQSRGTPVFTPVLEMFDDQRSFAEATLVAARISACFAVFVTRSIDPNLAALGRMSGRDSEGKPLESIQPGMVKYLREGESVSFGNPTQPSTMYDPFTTRTLRTIGSAIDFPYELVALDFSKVNFSSYRGAFNEARKSFRCRQDYLIESLCQPILESVIEEAWMRGDLPRVPFHDAPDMWSAAEWMRPAYGWFDPVVEAEAAGTRIALGLSTLSREVGEQGGHWEDVLAQRAIEIAKAKDLGVELGIAAGSAKSPAPIGDNDTEDQDQADEAETELEEAPA